MRTLKIIIIVLFTITILMLGSIVTINSFKESFKTDDLKNITLNPEEYLNRELTIIGNVYESLAPIDYRENGIKYIIYQESEYGFYSINLQSYKGKWVAPGKYRVKGIINYVDVCICEYKCVDYEGNCVYIHEYLYLPNLTIRNFKTNLTSHQIKSFWYLNYYFYYKTIDYLCPVNEKHYFECAYEIKEEFDAFNFKWQSFDGIFYKEYRCRPESLERIYYFEAIKPMEKI